MTPSIDAQSALRRRALRARRALDPRDRETASSTICQRVFRSHEFTASKAIGCYLPTRFEVDTTAIIERAWRMGKFVFAPVTDSRSSMIFRHLTPDSQVLMNDFGIWEPSTGPFIAPACIDLVITPLVAFDAKNYRIGMGGGYFDRTFSFLNHRHNWLRPKLIGVAFDCQEVEKITPNPWDIRLYRVFTETR